MKQIMDSEVLENSDTFRPTKTDIFTWWCNVLKQPKHIVAPMVDASELPWRLLSRKYNSDLCFTPMIHSKNFVKDPKYRAENLDPCKCAEDRPLIVQFCGNDPKILTQAATIVKNYCDGVDINLGCPQKIARTGHYGAFLQNEWDLIASIVKSININVGIPVSCKIRIFEDVEKTVQYAKMIQNAGCWMLTVHGRTISQKGANTGIADWNYIKAVRESVSIPVVANGNIQYLDDVQRCIDATGVYGVMSAEGNLHNPAIFAGIQPPVWIIALEYIQLAREYPCPISFSRGHLFKLCQHVLVLEENFHLREMLGTGKSLDCFEKVTLAIKELYEPYFLNMKEWVPPPNSPVTLKLRYPPWICQPYVRPPPSTILPSSEKKAEDKIVSSDASVEQPSKRSLKRLKKKVPINPRIKDDKRLMARVCLHSDCTNISGNKCDYKLCRICCKRRCIADELDCEGHRILIKSNIEKFILKNQVEFSTSVSDTN